MAKYIFLKPFSTTVNVGGVVGIRTFSYKVGDIVEGTVVRNNQTSEPPSFLVVDGTSGLLKIGFGGRTNPIIAEYSKTGTPANDGSGLKKSSTESTNFFTPKNIIIGVLAISTIFWLLKITKVI